MPRCLMAKKFKAYSWPDRSNSKHSNNNNIEEALNKSNSNNNINNNNNNNNNTNNNNNNLIVHVVAAAVQKHEPQLSTILSQHQEQITATSTSPSSESSPQRTPSSPTPSNSSILSAASSTLATIAASASVSSPLSSSTSSSSVSSLSLSSSSPSSTSCLRIHNGVGIINSRRSTIDDDEEIDVVGDNAGVIVVTTQQQQTPTGIAATAASTAILTSNIHQQQHQQQQQLHASRPTSPIRQLSATAIPIIITPSTTILNHNSNSNNSKLEQYRTSNSTTATATNTITSASKIVTSATITSNSNGTTPTATCWGPSSPTAGATAPSPPPHSPEAATRDSTTLYNGYGHDVSPMHFTAYLPRTENEVTVIKNGIATAVSPAAAVYQALPPNTTHPFLYQTPPQSDVISPSVSPSSRSSLSSPPMVRIKTETDEHFQLQQQKSVTVNAAIVTDTSSSVQRKSLAMCYTSTGATLSLPPKKKDIYRPYSLDDRPSLTERVRPYEGLRIPAEEDLHAAHAILDLSASTAFHPPTQPHQLQQQQQLHQQQQPLQPLHTTTQHLHPLHHITHAIQLQQQQQEASSNVLHAANITPTIADLAAAAAAAAAASVSASTTVTATSAINPLEQQRQSKNAITNPVGGVVSNNEVKRKYEATNQVNAASIVQNENSNTTNQINVTSALPSPNAANVVPGGIGGGGGGLGGVPGSTKTVAYTYEAFFVSDGRSKRKHVADPAAVVQQDQLKAKYTCTECGKKYATSSNLSRHKQTHRSLDSQSAKKCHTCGKAYVSMPALAMHVLTHKLLHSCDVCGKLFSRPWLLQGHLRSHTGEKPYGCAHCGKAFADRSNLRAHMQTHSIDKNFECKRCHKTFALKSYLNKHLESACLKDEADMQFDTSTSDSGGMTSPTPTEDYHQYLVQAGHKKYAELVSHSQTNGGGEAGAGVGVGAGEIAATVETTLVAVPVASAAIIKTEGAASYAG